jgi:hypothetical protein
MALVYFPAPACARANNERYNLRNKTLWSEVNEFFDTKQQVSNKHQNTIMIIDSRKKKHH